MQVREPRMAKNRASVVMDSSENFSSCVGREKCNNFRWLNAVKETKIEFFVRDNSGEKISHCPRS